MQTTKVKHACMAEPAEYWALYADERWHDYLASTDGCQVNVKSLNEVDGVITRVAQITTLENPVPTALRSMLGCSDGFTFEITEVWHRNKFDEAHPMKFTTIPAVMANRISVTGSHWVEPSPGGEGCQLIFELNVSVKVSKLVAGPLRRGIASGSLDAYRVRPARVMEYFAQRASATGVAPPSSYGSGASGLGATDAPCAASTRAEPSVDALEEEGRAKRARIRWHMALMGVRFQRALQNQSSDELRLCDARVDDPQNAGVGPRRHTTYRISTRVRQGDAGWMVVRKRFSHFLELRAALVSFLPGIELPALPQKRSVGKLSAEVIDERRRSLETFLQRVLDHPVLSTSDDLAAFLQWPSSCTDALHRRAKTFLNVPPSRLRVAHSLAWSRRRGASSPLLSPQPSFTSAQGSFHTAQGSFHSAADGSARTSSASFEAASTRVTPHIPKGGWASSGRLADGTSAHRDMAPETRSVDGIDADPSHRSQRFSDALAAAMMRTTEDAARTIQTAARNTAASRSASCRNTAVSDTEDGHNGEAVSIPHVAKRMSQRMWHNHVSEPPASPEAAPLPAWRNPDGNLSRAHLAEVDENERLRQLNVRLLHKLDEIEGRLRSMERARRSEGCFCQ